MTTTVFTDGVTLTAASWFNDADAEVYKSLTAVAGTNTITATGPAGLSAHTTGRGFRFTPAATNSGATTINPTCNSVALGAKNVFSNGAACVGGELVINVPVYIIYDGTQYNIIGGLTTGGVLDLSAGTRGQIKFPATQNASSNANTLDDYEEGTWTPTDGSGAGLAFTAVSATYTKTGRLTKMSGTVTYPVTASGANATISGLPFTLANTQGARSGFLSFASTANATYFLPTAASTSAGIITNGGAATTNLQLSTVQIFFTALSEDV